MLKKMIVLKSSDGDTFMVDETIALQSETIIAHQVKNDSANNVISLPNITSKTLAIVIEYCNKHIADSDEDLKKWDAVFMEQFVDDDSMLVDLTLAALYLSIKNLLDLTCKTIADIISHKTVEEVREFLGLVNDYTPEEEEALRIEYAWAFENDHQN